MKRIVALFAVLLVSSPLYACDIFQSCVSANAVHSNVRVNAHVSPFTVNATVPVAANVQTRSYSVVTPFAAPVVLQQAVPFVSNYSISSVQPVIGVNSIVPTSVRFQAAHSGFAANQVFVNSFGNKVLVNNHRGVVLNARGVNAFNVNAAGNNRVSVRRGLFGGVVVRAR